MGQDTGSVEPGSGPIFGHVQWVPLRWSASGPAKIDDVSGMTIYLMTI